MDQSKKAWVVVLRKSQRSKGKSVVKIDQKYVRARTKEGAVRTAKLNSFMPGAQSASYSVRVADPILDLGCSIMS